MKGKNIVIVGAGSGIGLSLAQILNEQEANVYGFARRSEPPHEHLFSSFTSFNALTEDLPVDDLPETIDGFVFCPGSIRLKPFARISPADFRDDYELNVVSAVRCLQRVIPQLKASGNASVIFFSTVAVSQGMPFHASISAAKAALEGLTRSLAAEFAPALRVNCIAPSLSDTPLAEGLLSTDQKREAAALRHPLKRVGDPKDSASLAAFLLSSQATWISGQVLHVDGGMSSIRI